MSANPETQATLKMGDARLASIEALKELAREGHDLIVLDADISKGTLTANFGAEFPERFFNLGIAEQAQMATAAGLATTGKTVFVATFAVFASMRACEQLRTFVCYPNLNVKVLVTNAGLTVGGHGVTHQSTEDIPMMRSIPNMSVLAPWDYNEMRLLVKAAASRPGPVYIRVPRLNVPYYFDPETYQPKIGRAEKLRQGKDVTLMSTGLMTARALKAAELLAAEGIEAGVLHFHTIKPLDIAAVLQAAHETGAVVTAEEGQMSGGFGGAIAELLAEQSPVPVARVGLADTFAESGEVEALFQKYGLTAEKIVEKAHQVLKLK